MLNSKPGWAAAKDTSGQWIQLNLNNSTVVVSGIQLQGRDCSTPNQNDWWRFKEYIVEFSMDGQTWEKVDGGKKFKGGDDSWTITDRLFRRPIRAKHLRIVIHSWHHHIAGRVDVIVGDRMEDEESGGGGERKDGGGGGERKVNQQPVRQQPRNRRKNVVNRARDWALKRRQQLAKERQERGDGQRRK